MAEDKVNHPKHYTTHPSGIECIQVTEHYNFAIGNAMKYLWRAGIKGGSSDPLSKQVEDLKKSIWYINREIYNIENGVYNAVSNKQNESVAKEQSRIPPWTATAGTATRNAAADFVYDHSIIPTREYRSIEDAYDDAYSFSIGSPTTGTILNKN